MTTIRSRRRGMLLLLPLALACRSGDRAPAPGDELRLSASGEGSEITAATREADLARRFGAASLRYGEISLAEGDATAGTTLFPDDSTRTMELVWRDSAARARPDFVRVSGTSSRWVLAPAIRLGTTLVELERLNGRPFALGGFDAGDNAIVTSWRGGRLDSLFAGPVQPSLTLAFPDPDSADVRAEERNRVTGSDSAVASSDPTVRRLNPRVVEIVLAFRDPGTAVEDRATTGALMAADALRRMPLEGRAPRDFVPPHWRVISEATGDLNGDGTADHAITVTPDEDDAANKSAQESDDYFPPPDIVVVLLADAGGRLRRVGANSRLSPHGFDARPHGMEIEGGVLTLNTNFGNDFATDVTYRFRYDRALGRLLLAGYDDETYSRSGTGDAHRTSEDYISGVRVEDFRYGTESTRRDGARPDSTARTTIERFRVPFEEVSFDDEGERPSGRPFVRG
jgi:hypothetical protein